MLVLRCTTKVFRKIRRKPQAVEVTPSGSQPSLGEWYVNTIDFIHGGELLLACMHADSLYTMLVVVEHGLDSEGLASAFGSHLVHTLLQLDVPPDVVPDVMAPYQEGAILAKTSCRSTNSYLTAIIREMEFLIEDGFGFLEDGRLSLEHLECRLNEVPRACGTGNPVMPLHEFWRCLRRLHPELPERRSLGWMLELDDDLLDSLPPILHECLPAEVSVKLYEALNNIDALFTADEFKAIEIGILPLIERCEGLLRDVLEDAQYAAALQRKRMTGG